MSKSTNHTAKAQYAGYGLHYHANNQLIPNTSDRMLFQCLIDVVRKQLIESLDNQTIIVSMQQLGRMAGMDANHTVPSCLKRLEKLGLIKKHKNGITISCDEYVTLIQCYESLDKSKKEQFVNDFLCNGIESLKNYSTSVKLQCRSELIGLSGSSIPVSDSELCKITEFPVSEDENTVILQRNGKTAQSEHCNFTEFSTNESKNTVKLQSSGKTITSEQLSQNTVILQSLAEQIAKTLYFFSANCNFTEFERILPPVILQSGALDDIKFAFSTGCFRESFINSIEKHCNFTVPTSVILQCLASKTLKFYSTVIIYNNKNNNKGDDPLKNEVQEEENENFQDDIKKGFEGFGKVEVIDFDKLSEDLEDEKGLIKGNEEIDDFSQQVLKRAERQLRDRNPYRKKPFIRMERIKEIVDCLDEVVKSPVDFFLYQFWWGIFDLYCEHYHPSSRINEEGEIEDEPQLTDWKEMIGATLPQDEVYSLVKNVYDDMLGAIEQGRYVYGDNNEWEVKFGFKTFQDFNPYEIFQWSPCTMQDKSVPALKIAIDRFYDIEANDVFTASKGDKRVKNSQNKKLIGLILSANDSDLSPMEIAIKAFYRDFVVSGDENIIDEFTDGKGTVLESGGGLPDHLLKPWCYNLSSVGYNELTGALCGKYKPCDGVHKKAYIFSAENVVEWNERNGYMDTVAHQALQ